MRSIHLCWQASSEFESPFSLQDSFFSPYLGQLARLAFLSSAIHQSVFTIFSNLPFAVGQVASRLMCF